MARLGSGVPLVARRQEVRTLRDALHRAGAGEAVGLLMSGDAGVGKSRLLSELLALARTEGHVVLLGRCLDTAEAALPYLPFAEVVGQLNAQDPELVGDHPALRRLLPDQPAPAQAGAEDRGLGQLQLFDALHAALGQLTLTGTVVLALEDLHWADRSSRDLLAFLLSRLTRQRLLVVGTFRSDDLHRRHPLRPLLAELLRLPAVERMHLEPFAPADAAAYVRTLADQTLPDDVVHNIAERSEGNAFMAEELVSAFSEQVPHELAEILLSRVERLSPPTQQTVRLASVVGRRFDHERISAASGTAYDAAAADATADATAELDQALREAVAHHVLVTEGREGPAQTYAFRHALLREAVYADLLPGERSRMHAQVARALAAGPGLGTAAELAHHRMESHDLPGALAASVRAARDADEIGAPAEMLVHTERSLRLWHAVRAPERVGGVDELELTRWAARAAGAAGEPDRAIAHSRAAIELVDAHGDALQAADLRRKYAQYLFTLDGSEQRAYDTSRQAWQLVADSEPSAVKAWAQATLARALAVLDRPDEAAELATEAMQTARAVPGGAGSQTAAEADALVTRTACVRRRQAGADEALELQAEAAGLAAKVGAHGVELRARFNRVATLLDEGRLPEALAEVDAGVERAAATGLTWSAYGLELRVRQVIGRFMAGDWDGAEAAGGLVGEAASGTVVTRVSAAALLVAVGRGEVASVERRLAQLRERWRVDQQVMTLVGTCGAELEMWRGRPEHAAEYVEQALRRLSETEPWHPVGLSLCALGIAAYADVAERARREQGAEVSAVVAAGEVIVRRAAETMAKGSPDSAEMGPEGRAWMARAHAEATRLRGERDPGAWRAVVEAFAYGETYRQACARWRLAETLLARGDPADRDEAAEQLRLAAQVADGLGAGPLREAVDVLARRARIGSTRDAAGVVSPLTPREQSVLALVAAGRTNRQVGTELFISEKTVSVHLSRVMSKLGAGSRTEAVSTAYARGLLTPTGGSGISPASGDGRRPGRAARRSP